MAQKSVDSFGVAAGNPACAPAIDSPSSLDYCPRLYLSYRGYLTTEHNRL